MRCDSETVTVVMPLMDAPLTGAVKTRLRDGPDGVPVAEAGSAVIYLKDNITILTAKLIHRTVCVGRPHVKAIVQ